MLKRLLVLIPLFFLLSVSIKSYALTVHFPFIEQSFGDGGVDTLEELDSWLQKNYVSGNVTVYIAPGTYTGSASWNFDAGENALMITGQNAKNLPVFDGCLHSPCEQGGLNGYFLRVEPATGRLKNITIQYIKIKNYVNGIYFNQVDNGKLRKVHISKIGSAFNKNIPSEKRTRLYNGFSAVTTYNVNDFTIEYNNIENSYNDDHPLWMHAIYLINTSNTKIYRNSIKNISGDPIRIRNQSDNILVERNYINNSGQVAISTFERVGEECPSINITARSNYYGMMFPYNAAYSRAGFSSEWANKNYLKEGLIQSQGYKVTTDPSESSRACKYRNVHSKWDVFTNENNHFIVPLADSRILNASNTLELHRSKTGAYVEMSKKAQIVLDTHFFFVACNSSPVSTCDNNGTSTIIDDIDGFNADNSHQNYAIRMTVKSGAEAKKLIFNGGGYIDYSLEIPANPDDNWFTFSMPFRLNVANRDDALLTWTALSSGLLVKEIRLSELR